MKNLLIYINPITKQFSSEHEDLTEIQIENSLDLGWKKEDLILVTNFPYQYDGVSSVVVNSYEYFDANRSTKIQALIELFERGFFQEDELYWFHDHDAFQLVPFDFKLQSPFDAAFTNNGVKSATWNAGSFFFKKSAQDIFAGIYKYMRLRSTNEQDALTYMWENNLNHINNRYQLLDSSYNLGIYKIPQNIANSQPPIKVAHFHPHKKHHLELFRDILPERLIKIFNRYGLN